MVDGIAFPPQITTTKPLSLMGHGMLYFSSAFLLIPVDFLSTKFQSGFDRIPVI